MIIAHLSDRLIYKNCHSMYVYALFFFKNSVTNPNRLNCVNITDTTFNIFKEKWISQMEHSWTSTDVFLLGAPRYLHFFIKQQTLTSFSLFHKVIKLVSANTELQEENPVVQ